MSLTAHPLAQDTATTDMAVAQSLLPGAEALAAECFRGIRDRRVTYESDPETGEHWIELHLTVTGTPVQVADAFDRYAARWVAAVPWPKHNWLHLSYTIA